MKIGVITTFDYILFDNYGSALQALAMQELLRSLGHRPFLIRRMEYPEKWLPSWFVPGYAWIGRFLPFLRARLDLYRIKKKLRSSSIRKARFISFFHCHITATPCGLTRAERMKRMPHADAYICGSDQIWDWIEPESKRDMSMYFSSVDRSRCLSYAVSGHWTELGERWIRGVAPYLAGFRAVGVREEDGVEMCKAAGGHNVEVTLDPTLMLPASYYEGIMPRERMVDEPYLLFYVLNMSSANDVPQHEVEEFCKAHGLRMIVLSFQGAEHALASDFNEHIGPLEFLNLIRHASAVVTNSFHGSCFCALFQVPYAICLQEGEMASQNIRFISTHKRLGQEWRIFHVGGLHASMLETKPADALPLLEEWRDKSRRYLVEHLQAIDEENKSNGRRKGGVSR